MMAKKDANVLPKLAAAGFLLLLSGCGRLGYESRYTADLTPAVSEPTAMAYYAALGKAIASSGVAAKDFAAASARIGEAIGQPLAPPEAVRTRQEMTVVGDSRTFDIAKNSPPEPLLPLAQERTRQVQALVYAMRQTAELTRVEVAAPAGFNYPAPASASADFDFPAVLDSLPSAPASAQGAGAEEAAAVEKKYEEIRKAAQAAVEQHEDTEKNERY